MVVPFLRRRPRIECTVTILLIAAGCAAQETREAPDSREAALLAGQRFLGLYSVDVKIGCGTMERTIAADKIVVALNVATDLKVAPGRLIAAYSRVLEFDSKPPRQVWSAVETIENPQQVSQSTRVERRTLVIEGDKAVWTRTVSRRSADGSLTKLQDEMRTTAVPKYTLDDELRAQVWIRSGATAGSTANLRRLDLSTRKTRAVRLQVVKRASSRSPGLADARMVLCTERDDAAGRETLVAFRPDGWPCFLDLERGLTVRAEPDGIAQSPIGWDGHVAGAIRVHPPVVSPSHAERLELRVGGSLVDVLEEGPGQRILKEAGSESFILHLDLKARREALGAAEKRRWSEPSADIPSLDRDIVAFARDAAKDAATQTTQDRVVALLGAVRETVAEEPIPDGVTAAQVLAYRKGGPRGRALLLVAGARALKIPAREVRGLAYEGGEHDSYYPHWWAEVEVDGAWLAVDPSASQIPADVAHIRCQPVPDAALPPASSAALTIGAKQ